MEENKESENISDPFKELQDKLAKIDQERDEYLNGWKRAKADLINYQKDEGKRFEEIMKFGITELIKDFIPVLDSFDLALSILEKEHTNSANLAVAESRRAPPPSGSSNPPAVTSSGEVGRGANAPTLIKGVYMIKAQLEDVLKKRGFEKMLVSIGEDFDPNKHESVGEMESDQPTGSITAIIENGYLLNGRVVRPARVKLSKTKN